NGWTLGNYTLTLSATDVAGGTGTASVAIHILADNDHDGIPAALDTSIGSSCSPTPTGDNDPSNAFADPDGDGILTLDDLFTAGGACTPATNYADPGDFKPDTLYVPSKGNPVTFYVTQASGTPNLKTINPTTVRIAKIGTNDVSDDPAFVNVGWS